LAAGAADSPWGPFDRESLLVWQIVINNSDGQKRFPAFPRS
jgi:hypothetical protein